MYQLSTTTIVLRNNRAQSFSGSGKVSLLLMCLG